MPAGTRHIVILSATEREQQPLRESLAGLPYAGPVDWRVTGMGAGAAAYGTLKAITRYKPALLIQAGIAGAFPDRKVELGDVVFVEFDRQADLGAWREETGRFECFAAQGSGGNEISCPYIESLGLQGLFPAIAARSVNTACSPLLTTGDEVVESMEGAAFFSVCRAEEVPFLQVRSISNRVGDPRDGWKIDEALVALAEGLKRLLTKL